MKSYLIFDSIIQNEKTTPLAISAKKLLEFLNIDAVSFKKAKADIGNEFFGLNKLKFLEYNAYNLTIAANEERDIVCFEQSSLISLAYAKELLTNDMKLKLEIAQRLEKHHISLNLNVNVISIEQLLVENVGIAKLSSLLKHPFTNFNASLFKGTGGCLAAKYNKPDYLNQLTNLIKLKCNTSIQYESDGYEILEASPTLAKKLASNALLSMFDSGVNFVLVSDARSFAMFDYYQEELEKSANRDIGITIFSISELLLLAFGVMDKNENGLSKHKVAVTLV